MKIVIIDKDELYLNRINSAFKEFYAQQIELCGYSDLGKAQDELKGKNVDILIIAKNINEKISEDSIDFQANLVIYFSDTKSYEEETEIKVVCKYQPIDQLYKEITDEYSLVNKFLAVTDEEKNPAQIFTFVSCAGGTGSSTASHGFARYLANTQKKVLFLSLEKLNSVDFFLKSDVEGGLYEAMEVIKQKQKNLSLKVSKCISTDVCGVSFISPCKNPLDMQKITIEDTKELLDIICSLNFDFVVIDTDLSFDESLISVFEKSSKILCITDATPMSNKKTVDMIDVIKQIDTQNETNIMEKIAVIYNKYNDLTSVTIENRKIAINGAIPSFSACKTPCDVSVKISDMAMWSNVIKTAVQVK